MSKRIEKLTPEQESMMTAHADKWIAYGLNTDPADFDKAVEGIKACYEFAGIPWHGNVVRVSSPIVMALAGPIASTILSRIPTMRSSTPKKDHGAVGSAVGVAVGGAVRDAVDGAVRDAVGVAVGVAVGGAVRDAVDGAVYGAVRDAVGVAVDDAVRGAVRGAVHGAVAKIPQSEYRDVIRRTYNQYTGGYWTWWASLSAFFRDHTDLELNGNLWDRSRAFEQTIANAGWWWPHKEFVIVVDRPTQIHREQVGERGWNSHRLHNTSGPAISWRDDWALYFIHGVRVTEQIVLYPETLTSEQILKEENAEVRRVMCERLGWDKFVEQAKLVLIDECDDPGNFPNKIRLYDTPEQVLGVPVRLMLVTNATPKLNGEIPRYGVTVPAEIRTAGEAAAWSFDVPIETYQSLARAT